MKEVTQDHFDTEVEIVAEQQQKKEIKLIGQQRKIPGLTLWEYNERTKELAPAQFKRQDFELTTLDPEPPNLHISHRVHVNEGCIYFQALNRKNAEKKLHKILNH